MLKQMGFIKTKGTRKIKRKELYKIFKYYRRLDCYRPDEKTSCTRESFEISRIV